MISSQWVDFFFIWTYTFFLIRFWLIGIIMRMAYEPQLEFLVFFAILLRHNRLIWLANTKWITNQVVNNLFVSRNKETHKIIKTQNKTRRVQNKWQQFWFSTQFSPTIDKLTCIHTQTCSSLHLHVFKQKKKTLTQTDDGKKEQKCFGCTRVLIVWMIVKD